MSTARPRPTPAQIAATDPERSNWVGANAGSGKTHVLTQRVARLLLAGSAPQKILCLTYTKAAASEMQTRLFKVLGEWAMEPEEALAQRLGDLTGENTPATDPEQIAQARRLFARALETPGGLKIQTIHAFCDALLRRFPLEAGVSPRFEVLDDRQSKRMLSDIRAEMGLVAENGEDDAFDRAAKRLNEGDVDALIRAVLSQRHMLDPDNLDDCIDAYFGEIETQSAEEMATTALDALDWNRLRSLAAVIASVGGKTEQPLAIALDVTEQQRLDTPHDCVNGIIGTILTKGGEPRKPTNFPTKAVRETRASAEAEYADLSDWALQTLNWFRMKVMATRTRDLHVFARGLLTRYETEKRTSGLLDFDDLILRARNLLTREDMRSWVLFKLDQGIDHILVDEAQDTSPLQWQIIAAIAEEFLSGDGARIENRSIFVVGDEKQSIYSFQGAEPKAFGTMRAYFADRLTALGTPLGRPDLVTSFRSAPAILDFVDAVFTGDAAKGLTVEGDAIRHAANRTEDHGRVDLWPAIEPAEHPDPPDWWDPVDATPTNNAKELLAKAVAEHIRDLVDHGTMPVRDGLTDVPIEPADIMILVTQRDALARGLIRQLKKLGVPVAGADRLSLAAELAVKDLIALAKVAVMPSDDLSLAALLRSPLCGLSEEDLFSLAHGRTGTLWHALMTSEDFPEARTFLEDMSSRADFLRPYEFLERALRRYSGRKSLLARLGTEAEDPIDELLTQALAYEAREVPSLIGFITWIEASNITVKREMESGTNEVRLMTVHGSKGLEAPIVILPDTFSVPSAGNSQKLFQTVPDGNKQDLTLWAGAQKLDDTVTAEARAAANASTLEERRRLLYVALTRAESWLIICGAKGRRQQEGTWYDLISAGMARLERTCELQSPTKDGMMTRFETGQSAGTAIASRAKATSAEPVVRPDWLTLAPSETRPIRLSPSTLGDHGGAPLPTGTEREAALLHGNAVHMLLEHYALDTQTWAGDAIDRLQERFPDLDQETRDAVLNEVQVVLSMPEAKTIFGPNSVAEASIAISPDLAQTMVGRIDRIVIDQTAIRIIDFKSDAHPPRAEVDVPQGYLAQLGAYRSALRTAYPDRDVSCQILWTRTPYLMSCPADAVDHAYQSALTAHTGSA